MAKQHGARFVALVEEAKKRVTDVTLAEVKARLDRGDEFVLIDVREDHEWAQGHVPGAEHLGRGILERDVEARFPALDTDIVLYCGGGYRSTLAADNLGKMGYTRVRSMDGGWRGWTEKGYPVTQPEGAKR